MALNDVSEFLHAQVEQTTEKTIECRRCGELCPEKVEKCPSCGEKPIFPSLAEWGRQLPIGIVNLKEKKLGREFTVKKVDFRVEREISDYWNKYRKSTSTVTVFDYLACVLAFTVTSLDGQDLQRLPVERRLAVIRQMFMGDVFYIYAYVRVETLGPDFIIKMIECPMCGRKFDFPVDLMTLEISTRENYDDLYKAVDLRDGFVINNILRKKVTMMPFTFNAIAGADNDNDTDNFASLLKACVCSIEEMPDGIGITDAEINQLSKYDMATLDTKIDIVSGGPVWAVDMKCPNASCGNEWVLAIDWRYATFFSHYSRSTPRRRSKT